MEIVPYDNSDFGELKALADKHNLKLPQSGKIIIAKDSSRKITAFAIMRPIISIEPMVSENPIAAVRIFQEMEWWMQQSDTKILRGFVKRDLLETAKKAGFNRVFGKLITIEKLY